MAPQEKISMRSSEKIRHADNDLSIYFSVRTQKYTAGWGPISAYFWKS